MFVLCCNFFRKCFRNSHKNESHSKEVSNLTYNSYTIKIHKYKYYIEYDNKYPKLQFLVVITVIVVMIIIIEMVLHDNNNTL